jgi:hypothetical protein
MKMIQFAFVASTLLGGSRPGCGPFRPERGEGEEKKPPTVIEICDTSSTQCYRSCFKREASQMCGSCCFQQFILCNNKEKYSFEPCEAIDPAPVPRPEGSTGDKPAQP